MGLGLASCGLEADVERVEEVRPLETLIVDPYTVSSSNGSVRIVGSYNSVFGGDINRDIALAYGTFNARENSRPEWLQTRASITETAVLQAQLANEEIILTGNYNSIGLFEIQTLETSSVEFHFE